MGAVRHCAFAPHAAAPGRLRQEARLHRDGRRRRPTNGRRARSVTGDDGRQDGVCWVMRRARAKSPWLCLRSDPSKKSDPMRTPWTLLTEPEDNLIDFYRHNKRHVAGVLPPLSRRLVARARGPRVAGLLARRPAVASRACAPRARRPQLHQRARRKNDEAATSMFAC